MNFLNKVIRKVVCVLRVVKIKRPNAQKYISDLKALKGDETAYVKKRQLVTQFATRLDLDKKLTALCDEVRSKFKVFFENFL